MTKKRKNPVALAGAHRARKRLALAAEDGFENTPADANLQALRAAYVLRHARHGVTPRVAQALAEIVFESRGRA